MNDQNKNRNVLSRREFLKTIGAAGMAATGLTACTGGENDGIRHDASAFRRRPQRP